MGMRGKRCVAGNSIDLAVYILHFSLRGPPKKAADDISDCVTTAASPNHKCSSDISCSTTEPLVGRLDTSVAIKLSFKLKDKPVKDESVEKEEAKVKQTVEPSTR